jgi:hypothetical protein
MISAVDFSFPAVALRDSHRDCLYDDACLMMMHAFRKWLGQYLDTRKRRSQLSSIPQRPGVFDGAAGRAVLICEMAPIDRRYTATELLSDFVFQWVNEFDEGVPRPLQYPRRGSFRNSKFVRKCLDQPLRTRLCPYSFPKFAAG